MSELTRYISQRKGILRAFDSASYLASVQLIGSLKVLLSDIPVARNIPAAEMIIGRFVQVTMFDLNNPKDSVITGVYT